VRYKFEDITINSTEKKKPTPADKDVYLGLEHLDPGSLEVTRFGSDVAPIGEKLIMKKGDVLFGKRRAYQKKVAIAPFDGIFSAHGMVLRPNEAVVDGGFFPLFISSDYFLDAAIKISVGSLSPTINWRDLKELTFELPPLEEQRRLAGILWAGIETRNAYNELLTRTEKLVKSQFVEMFGNKDKYAQSTVESVCTRIVGGGTPSKSKPEYYTGEIPWVTPKDMKSSFIIDSIDHITDEAVENSTVKLIPEQSVLMVIRSGILKHSLPVAINTVPVTVNQDMKAFIVGDKITSEFLMYTFEARKNDLLSNVRAVTADNIEFEIIRKMMISLPPLDLQHRFADFVRAADKSKFTALQQARRTKEIEHLQREVAICLSR